VDAGGYQGDLRDMTKPLSIYFRGDTLRGWYQLTPLSGASWQLVWLGDAA
jgi:hypothetical protein